MNSRGLTRAGSRSPRVLLAALVSPATLMPVREMEELIALGPRAVEPVLAALREARGGAVPDPLYLIVVAGELRAAELVSPLVEFLGDAGADPAAGIAAMEALARIGESSVPELERLLATNPSPPVRVHVYGALGLIESAAAAHVLLGALERDPALAGTIGSALARHRVPGSLTTLYEAYLRAPDHENVMLEDALRELAGVNEIPSHPFTRNWRVRYRRRPAQNWSIEPGWESQALLAWRLRDRAGAPRLPDPPKHPLEEILADADEEIEPAQIELRGDDAPRGYCPRCGRREEEIAGIRTCPLLARELITAQRGLLSAWREDGKPDLYALLDELDRAQAEGLQALAALPGDECGEAHDSLTRRLDRLAAEQRTVGFLVEEGCATTDAGLTHLTALARRTPTVSREELELHGIVPSSST